MKTVYCLRLRVADYEVWGQPTYYRKRKERDKDASMNRIMAGLRTWSYEEKKTAEEIEAMTQ